MPEIKQIPRMRIAYVTSRGPFSESISRGLDRLESWRQENGVEAAGAPIVMFPDDPSEVPAEQLRSEVGIPVGPEVQGSGEVQIRELDDFDAATHSYRSREDFDRVYGEVYQWLHEQGYHDAGAPMESYLGVGDDFLAEIYIPVRRAEPPEMEPETAEPMAPRPPARKRAAKKGAGKKTTKKTATKKRAAKKSSAKKTARKTGARRRARR